MNKKIIAAVAFVVLMIVGGISVWYWKVNKMEEHEVHLHAGFQVYANNELVDFTADKYMHFKPCGEEDLSGLSRDELKQHEMQERAHLHDNIGDVVHVHKEDVVWNDLFTNLGYEINEDVTGYLNGNKIEEILDEKIKAYDSLVILIGENSDIESKIANKVTIEHIKETEAKVEGC